jgi:hypothetical protein
MRYGLHTKSDLTPPRPFPDDSLVAAGERQFLSTNTANDHDSVGDSRRPDA